MKAGVIASGSKMTTDPVFPKEFNQFSELTYINFKYQGKPDHKRVSSPYSGKNIFIVVPEIDHGSFNTCFLQNGYEITYPQVFFFTEGNNKNRIICLVQSSLCRILKYLYNAVNKFGFLAEASFVISQHQ